MGSPRDVLKPGKGRTTMPDVLNLISRILLSAVFIVYGRLAFADVKAWVTFNQAALKRFFDMVAGGMAPPTWFGYLIATIQLVGGLAILAGFKTRWVAYAFVAYLVLVDFFAHNFWDMQGAARGANMAHFYKNLGIMGGFLLLALQGAGRYSADAQMSRSWLSRQMSRIGLSRG
jgi:putative oxidoreductase